MVELEKNITRFSKTCMILRYLDTYMNIRYGTPQPKLNSLSNLLDALEGKRRIVNKKGRGTSGQELDIKEVDLLLDNAIEEIDANADFSGK